MTDIETDAVERTCIELDNYSFAASNLGVQDKMRLLPKASKQLRTLRAELDRVTAINVEHCRAVNTLLVDNARWEERTKAAEAEVERLREAKTQAATDVLAERARQVSAEGWTPEHDDAHDRDELSAAAACYAYFGWVKPSNGMAPTEWPWDAEWWKPTDRRRDLVKAGALILAEIERLDRATLETPHDDRT